MVLYQIRLGNDGVCDLADPADRVSNKQEPREGGVERRIYTGFSVYFSWPPHHFLISDSRRSNRSFLVSVGIGVG